MDSILPSSPRFHSRIPQSQDPFLAHIEAERRELLLNNICNSAIAFVLPLALLYIFALFTHYSWQTTLSMALVALLVPVGLFTRHLARRGSTTAGARLFLYSHIVIVVANSWLIAGLFEVVAVPLILFIIMAGMIVGAKEANRLALVGGVLWLLTRIALRQELILPRPLTGVATDLVGDVAVLSTFIFVVVLGQLAIGTSHRSLVEATRELRRENRELARANDRKSQFTASTSHELRTPLGAIMVFADLMLRRAYGPLTDKQADSLERILRSAKRLNGLVNDILDLSRIEAGQLEMVNRCIQVQALVDNVGTTMEPQALEKGLKLAWQVAPDMPRFVLGDERRLAQILTNLVDNAIKYTEEGEVTATVERLYGTHWKMVVRDTGPGIQEENLERVFRPYQREETEGESTQVQGTGLGLSITRHLVEMMGGRIHLESTVGQGSAFEIILPLKVTDGETDTG